MVHLLRFHGILLVEALIVVLSATLALGAVPPIAPAAVAAEHAVQMGDNFFVPASITIAVGDTVTWTNAGQAVHTTTSDQGLWDSGLLQPGSSYSHTFTAAGTYPYHCSVHPGMVGTITVAIVQPAPAAPVSASRRAAPVPAAPTAMAAPASSPVPVASVGLPATGTGGLVRRKAPSALPLTAGFRVVLAGFTALGVLAIALYRRQ